jgi:hypothetical protein
VSVAVPQIPGMTPEMWAAIQAQLGGAAPAAETAPAAPAIQTPSGHPKSKIQNPAVDAVVAGTVRRGGFLADLSFGDVDDAPAGGGGGGPLPEDLWYEAEIIKAELTTSSSGNEMIKLTEKITFPEAHKGRFVFDNVMTRMEGYPRQRTKSLFRATDLLTPDGLAIAAESEQDLVHQVVRFRVKNEEYNGKTNPKVDGGYIAAFETPGLE